MLVVAYRYCRRHGCTDCSNANDFCEDDSCIVHGGRKLARWGGIVRLPWVAKQSSGYSKTPLFTVEVMGYYGDGQKPDAFDVAAIVVATKWTACE